jgi:hypothetical protein
MKRRRHFDVLKANRAPVTPKEAVELLKLKRVLEAGG